MKSSDYLIKAMNKKRMKAGEFSRFIGVTDSAMSKILKGNRYMDTYTCIHVSDILDVDPMMLISLTNSEREKNSEKKEFFVEKVKEYGYVSFSFAIFLTSISSAFIYYVKLTNPFHLNKNTYEGY